MSTTVVDRPVPGDAHPVKMDPISKLLLLAALRSGQYSQTTDTLRDSKGFCGLGMFCEVFRQATGHGEWLEYPHGGGWAFLVDDHVECGELPTPVAEWYGLTGDLWVDGNPMVAGKPISVWNDHDHANFQMLADMIEAEM